jgi:hypothetical protein
MSKLKVEIRKQKVSELKNHEDNPRIIKDKKYKELLKSIEEFGEMLDIREIVVDENNVVLGGNMRLKALQELGIKNVTVKKVTGLNERQKKEFVIKDNVSFGEWNWDNLANSWENEDLNNWGLEVWTSKQPDKVFDFKGLGDEDGEATQKEAKIKPSITTSGYVRMELIILDEDKKFLVELLKNYKEQIKEDLTFSELLIKYIKNDK